MYKDGKTYMLVVLVGVGECVDDVDAEQVITFEA